MLPTAPRSVQRQEGWSAVHRGVLGHCEEGLLTRVQRPFLAARGGPADCATGLTPPPLDSSAEALAAGGEEGLSTCTARAHEWLWLPLERHSQQARTAQDSSRRRLAAAARLALEARVGQLCRACNANRVVCRV